MAGCGFSANGMLCLAVLITGMAMAPMGWANGRFLRCLWLMVEWKTVAIGKMEGEGDG
jgi:hypothetical protein